MIIDWYSVIFQIINFLVLVFLLRRFLYGPIIRAMDEREQKIIEREEKAASEREKAEKEALQYREQKEELEQKEDEIIEEAREKAEKEKHELVSEAREEVEETRRRWEEAFEREKETFIVELRRRIGQQACSIARRCLEDLADARLEELTWDLFLEKIKALPEEEISELTGAIADDNGEVILQSAFEPSEEKANELRQVLQNLQDDSDKKLDKKSGKESDQKSGQKVKLELKTDQNLICGLELSAGGYRVAWSMESYLDDVEAEILKDLEQEMPGAAEGEVLASDEGED